MSYPFGNHIPAFNQPPYSGDSYNNLPSPHEILAAIALSLLNTIPRQHQQGANQYTHFSPESAEEFYQLSSELVTYTHDENVGALVLVDKAARPAYIGINEVWRAKYPNEKRPLINFMNSGGLITPREMSPTLLFHLIKENSAAGIGPPKESRSNVDISQEFSSTFAALLEHKEDPVIVLDSCLHSGETIQPIMTNLDQHGFVDVRLVVADGADIEPSAVQTPDLILRSSTAGGCYPFGHKDTMVVKTMESVTSPLHPQRSAREEGQHLRNEAREIIRERLQRDGLLAAPAT